MRAVLTYHSIDPSGSVISIDEATLQQHIDFLAGGSVRVVPLPLLSVPDDVDAVALTFDDGFANFATAAWPRLHAAGLPATVFVVTDRVAGDNDWDGSPQPGIPTLPLMGWDTLGMLAGQGLDLGSHTRTHRRLVQIDDDALLDELSESSEQIQSRTGVRPRTMAYPYGDHDERAVAATRGVYESAWTTVLGVVTRDDDAHRMPRLDAYYFQEPGRLDGFGTLGFGAFVKARALARSVRARVRRGIGRIG